MTDYWESDGSNGIRPNVDKNIVPPSNEVTNKDVGESDDRWTNAYIVNLDASITGMINSSDSSSGKFTVKGSGEYVPYLIYADAQVNRVKLGTLATIAGPGEARTILCQDDPYQDKRKLRL
ncbi:hypothetical protein J7K50_05745 [bacterium]|nr:hypothetical protein [bacterium]